MGKSGPIFQFSHDLSSDISDQLKSQIFSSDLRLWSQISASYSPFHPFSHFLIFPHITSQISDLGPWSQLRYLISALILDIKLRSQISTQISGSHLRSQLHILVFQFSHFPIFPWSQLWHRRLAQISDIKLWYLALISDIMLWSQMTASYSPFPRYHISNLRSRALISAHIPQITSNHRYQTQISDINSDLWLWFQISASYSRFPIFSFSHFPIFPMEKW